MTAPDAYVTRGGITVRRTIEEIPLRGAIEPLIDALDRRRGVLLASSYEYPGRYTRWDVGFVDPPVQIVGRGREFRITALNSRGGVLLPVIQERLAGVAAIARQQRQGSELVGEIAPAAGRFPEELRSRQPSLFSLLRALLTVFASDADGHLGLYGAFGYDLALQFEPLRLTRARPADQQDLVLYLPDELVVVDHGRDRAERRRYEFEAAGRSTSGLERAGHDDPQRVATGEAPAGDHAPGEYAEAVRRARGAFAAGDLFEVVLSQTVVEPCPMPPAELFRRVRARNPSPYGFLINLGQGEHLVGASPEMYVRVEGDRVETCPVCGTIARGEDAIGDAAQVLRLLNSRKDEAELTMCTDVDRNDKSRICRPGSVRVIGRRQIEMYARVIHTVDHVEGRLRPEFDALDAFLSHAWAVTVTGAPKTGAMQFIEDHEKSSRAWYGGAVGMLGFDGNLNTGLTLRTLHLRDGAAVIRVGATLLWDSDPDEEEAETRLKAAAFLDALRRPTASVSDAGIYASRPGDGRRIVLVDHQDSFVHTLANYLRQTGAEVVTWRAGFPPEELDALDPDLIVLSPGPGRPKDFDVAGTLAAAIARGVPVFGVCLGLQAMVEYVGGELGVLTAPMHGKASRILVRGGAIFRDLPPVLTAGRYHSLFARRETLPPVLRVTADSEDGVVMAIEHVELPWAAVQFHPESILTLGDDVGRRLIHNVVGELAGRRRRPVA